MGKPIDIVKGSVEWRFFYALLIMLIGHLNHYRKKPKQGIDGVIRIPQYYGHLLRVCGHVMELGGNTDSILLALIHDILEDTFIPKWMLLPLGKHMVYKVELLTQDPSLPKPIRKRTYCDRLALSGDLDALLVAICDKWDNWKCYEMEGDISPEVISYYNYFLKRISSICSHPLLPLLLEGVKNASGFNVLEGDSEGISINTSISETCK